MFRPMQSALAVRRQRSRRGGKKKKGGKRGGKDSYDNSPRPSIISINDDRYKSEDVLRKTVSK